MQFFLAQITGAEWGVVGVVVMTLLGLLVWHVQYTSKVVIPGMVRDHSATVAVLVERFTTDQREARQLFKEIIGEERQSCERRHAENREIFKGMIADLKDQRHSLRDLRQEVVLHMRMMEQVLGMKEEEEKKK